MRQQIYSIYDVASGLYQRPFVAQSDGQVTRSFSDLARDSEHEIGQHPEDYTLFSLATFNDNTGEIVGHPAPEKIATALELIAIDRNVKKDQLDFDASD